MADKAWSHSLRKAKLLTFTAMFCSRCGKNISEINAKYCSTCGFYLLNTGQDIQAAETARDVTKEVVTQAVKVERGDKPVLSYSEFRKRKEENRQEHFRSNSSSKGKSKIPKKAENTDATINVGLRRLKNGKLNNCRGRNLPISVPPSATRDMVLQKAVEKHLKHDRSMVEGIEYTLVYPDGSEVLSMPGSEEPFVLKKYKDEVGRTYSRITLYLTTKSDYLFNEVRSVQDLVDSDSSCISENENDENLMKSAFETGNENIKIAKVDLTTNSAAPALDANNKHVQPSCSLTLSDVTCPTCFEVFPITQIAAHADSCADIWIGEVEIDASASGSSSETQREIISSTETPATTSLLVSNTCMNYIDVKPIILELSTQFVAEEDTRVNIRRKHLWLDYKESRKKFNFTPECNLRIVFIGEPAVDDGGPKKEFFSEMMDHIERSLFIAGSPINSTVSLFNGDFRLAGELMVMSVLQGGPAPCFLDAAVFSFLAQQPLSPDVCNFQENAIAFKLKDASDDSQVREILLSDEGLEALHEIGYKGVPHRETKSSVNNIIQSLCIKEHLSGFMPQLMQLQEGLRACNVLRSVHIYPNLWQPIFTKDGKREPIKATEFLDQLMAEFSTSQRKKEVEIDVYKYFCDYILGLDLTNGSAESDITIPEILKWLTGCSVVPPLGFPKKFSLVFLHGCTSGCKCRPTVSTCDLKLRIPVHIESQEEMAEIMASALQDCYGFGLI